jgi:hypothetical protein
VGIVFFYVFPSLDIERTLIIKTYKQIRGSPSEAVAKGKRGDFPYIHFHAAVRARRFFLGKDLF